MAIKSLWTAIGRGTSENCARLRWATKAKIITFSGNISTTNAKMGADHPSDLQELVAGYAPRNYFWIIFSLIQCRPG
jgi:hypothetical protein